MAEEEKYCSTTDKYKGYPTDSCRSYRRCLASLPDTCCGGEDAPWWCCFNLRVRWWSHKGIRYASNVCALDVTGAASSSRHERCYCCSDLMSRTSIPVTGQPICNVHSMCIWVLQWRTLHILRMLYGALQRHWPRRVAMSVMLSQALVCITTASSASDYSAMCS